MSVPRTDIASAAAVRISLRHPFWCEVFYSMTIREATPEEAAAGIQTEATDGRNLWINKDFWKSIPLDQQVAELVHELFHKILLHNTRRGSRDPYLWNVACDYVINAGMKKMGFNFPTSGDKAWLFDPQYEGALAEQVYADLMKKAKQQPQPKPGQGQPQQGQGQGMKGQPGVPKLAPGREDLKDAAGCDHPETRERIEQEIKAMVDRAVAMAKAMGNLPAGIEKEVAQAGKAAREPWYNHLHRYMQSLAVSEYNWARINRRAMLTHKLFAPLHYSEALGEVRLYIDTSGSCYAAAQQTHFAMHLNAILAEAKPRRVVISYFDTKVYPGEEIEAGTLEVDLRPRGGGGTSFVPIFEDLAEAEVPPDIVIILTDLCGTFPSHEPDCPVMWACTEENEVAPFGETIHVCND
jgi:predicted metal-dependent peptidase